MKKSEKNKSIIKYQLTFEMRNNNCISVITTPTEFENIKSWYENNDTNSYDIKNNTISEKGDYINIKRDEIIRFSYCGLTEKKDLLNGFKNLLEYPVSNHFTAIGFVKILFLAPVIFLVYMMYQKFILNLDLNNVIQNKEVFIFIIEGTVSIVTAIFLVYYTVLLLGASLKICNGGRDILYSLKSSCKDKKRNYAVYNLVIILIINYILVDLIKYI